jgi:hypothetical protein
MAETTLLRSSAIVQNASVGTSRPPLVNTGALPLVQVKMPPAGPQVHEGQQKPVQILPGKDPKGAVAAGGLPMVQVKMTQNGPQLDDGQNRPVVIKDNLKGTVAAGGLPMVQVKMTQAGPQVQNVPNVQGGPPQIPSAAPALSAVRVPRVAAPQQVQVRRIAAPQQVVHAPVPHVQLAPQLPEFSIEQLMLCRHLLDRFVDEQRAGNVAADSSVAENIKIAEDTIFVIDQTIAATTAHAQGHVQAPAEVAVEAPVATIEAPVAAIETPAVAAVAAVPARPTVGYVQPAAYPVRRGYVQPRPGVRTNHAAGGARTGNAAMAPRRVARNGQSGLPPVIVKMEGQQAVVQNQAEVAAAKEAHALAQAQAQAQAQVQAQALTDEQILAQARAIQDARDAAAAAAQVTPSQQAIEVEATPTAPESAPTQTPGDGGQG